MFLFLFEVKMNIEFIKQLVDSMNDSVLKLEKAIKNKKEDDANKLRTFIFDLYRQINKEITEKNV